MNKEEYDSFIIIRFLKVKTSILILVDFIYVVLKCELYKLKIFVGIKG